MQDGALLIQVPNGTIVRIYLFNRGLDVVGVGCRHGLPCNAVLRADGDFACPDGARGSSLGGNSILAVLGPLVKADRRSLRCLRLCDGHHKKHTIQHMWYEQQWSLVQ